MLRSDFINRPVGIYLYLILDAPTNRTEQTTSPWRLETLQMLTKVRLISCYFIACNTACF